MSVFDTPTTFRNRQVLQHQGLVHQIAESIWELIGRAVPLEDLIAYGQIGLIEAVERFDVNRGCQFSTFAYYRIRGAILDGLCKMQGISRRMLDRIRFFRGLHAWVMQYGDLTERTCSMHGRLKMLEELLQAGAVIFIMYHLPELAERHCTDTGETQVIRSEWHHQIKRALWILDRNERYIVRELYFGGKRLSEIAESLGISRSWASRLHRRALQKMRRYLECKTDPPGTGSDNSCGQPYDNGVES